MDTNDNTGSAIDTIPRILFTANAIERTNLAGIFATVRLGYKWWNDLTVGDIVEYGNTGVDDALGEVEVLETWAGFLSDVPARFLDAEHAHAARTYAGLLLGMNDVYTDVDIDGNTQVTVLRLRVIPATN